jgi:hypothetical protein
MKSKKIDDLKQILCSSDQKKAKDFLYHYFKVPSHFDQFCYFVLPDAFNKDFAPFHMEVISEFIKDDNSAVACPRNSGKSTLIGLGYVLWMILYKKKQYVVYTSQNHQKSVSFLKPIKSALRNNPVIKFIWGEQYIRSSVDNETGKDSEDCFDVKGEMRIQALSFEKNIRGLKYGVHRPDLIILDDIEDDSRVLNPDLRLKDMNKLNKEMIPALAIGGNYKFIGTILHLDSLLMKKIHVL